MGGAGGAGGTGGGFGSSGAGGMSSGGGFGSGFGVGAGSGNMGSGSGKQMDFRSTDELSEEKWEARKAFEEARRNFDYSYNDPDALANFEKQRQEYEAARSAYNDPRFMFKGAGMAERFADPNYKFTGKRYDFDLSEEAKARNKAFLDADRSLDIGGQTVYGSQVDPEGTQKAWDDMREKARIASIYKGRVPGGMQVIDGRLVGDNMTSENIQQIGAENTAPTTAIYSQSVAPTGSASTFDPKSVQQPSQQTNQVTQAQQGVQAQQPVPQQQPVKKRPEGNISAGGGTTLG